MNKKTIILVIALIIATGAGILWYVGRDIENPSPKNNIAEETDNDDTQTGLDSSAGEISMKDWLTFGGEETGIEFMYPKDFVIKIENEKPGFDLGKKRNIYVQSENGEYVFALSLTSKNYAEGVGEGCCFYYSAEPLNIELPIEKIDELIKDLEPVNIKKINIDNREGVRFYSLKSYGSVWIEDSILLPYNHGDFTNMLITGPILETISINNNSEKDNAKKQITEDIQNETYLTDEKIAYSYKIFNQILETLKFVE